MDVLFMTKGGCVQGRCPFSTPPSFHSWEMFLTLPKRIFLDSRPRLRRSVPPSSMFSWMGSTCLWISMELGNSWSAELAALREKESSSDSQRGLTLGERVALDTRAWLTQKGFLGCLGHGFILGMIPGLVSAGAVKDETWPRCPSLNFLSLFLCIFTFFPHQTIPRVKGSLSVLTPDRGVWAA